MRQTALLLAICILLAACGGEEDAPPEIPPTQELESTIQLPPRPADLPTTTIAEIVDADTLRMSDGQQVRLLGIDLPNTDEFFHSETMMFLQDNLVGAEVGLERGGDAQDEATRSLYYVWQGDVLVNFDLVRKGYAYYLPFSAPSQYDAYLQQAEQASVEAGLGLWQRSPLSVNITQVRADPVGDDAADLNGEVVRLINSGREAVEMDGITLRDTDGNIYQFADLTLNAGRPLAIYTGCGRASSTELYWCNEEPIWDNAREIVLLRDADGLYLDHQKILGP